MDLSSGKRLHIELGNHNFSCENSLRMAMASVAILTEPEGTDEVKLVHVHIE